jgi:hypothetical protein
MEKSAVEKMIMEEIKDLSEEHLDDVLDFIGYLKAKKVIQPYEKEITDETDDGSSLESLKE